MRGQNRPIRIVAGFILLLLIPCARACPGADAQVADPMPRFIPSAWFPVDLHTRRLSTTTDVGVIVRFWSLGSTIHGGENVFGPVIGPRTVGFGWVWRFRDSSLCAGLAGVVETGRLFDKTKTVTVMPAVTLSYRLPATVK